MGTKLTELRDGCFAKALDDEPMFILLARDVRAPDLTEEWADQRAQEIRDGKRPASDMAQVTEAYQTADKMRAWRKANDGAWRTGLFATTRTPCPHDDTSLIAGAKYMPDRIKCHDCGDEWDKMPDDGKAV